MQAGEERAATVDAYIAAAPEGARAALQELRAVIREVAPEAQETISYQMPTFVVGGRSVVYVAAYKRHIGLYPAPLEHPELAADLAPYAGGRGTARFPLGRPLPLDLIRRVVAHLVERSAARG